jgi:hypothetical protein
MEELRLCGLVVRIPGYTTEMNCASCEVRTELIRICYVEESRPPLWSTGQSSWLHNGDVLCFLWGSNWIDICYVEESHCGLVVRVPGYRSRDPGSIPCATGQGGDTQEDYTAAPKVTGENEEEVALSKVRMHLAAPGNLEAVKGSVVCRRNTRPVER